jgi:hypothetical protein
MAGSKQGRGSFGIWLTNLSVFNYKIVDSLYLQANSMHFDIPMYFEII